MALALIIFYPLVYLSGEAASPITLKMVVHRTSPGLLCYLCALGTNVCLVCTNHFCPCLYLYPKVASYNQMPPLYLALFLSLTLSSSGSSLTMSFKERLTLFLKSETETEPELKRCPHPSELGYLVPSELGYYRHNQVISMVNQLDNLSIAVWLAVVIIS